MLVLLVYYGSSIWLGNPVGVTSLHGIVLDHQLIIYSQALATSLIRISIVYGIGVHSYRALKYAGTGADPGFFEGGVSVETLVTY